MQFWNQTQPLTPLKEALWEKFMPASGATEYVEAESMRAMNRLIHDCYNNGWGNEMSHALAYLEKYHFPVATPEFKRHYPDVKEAAMEPWQDARPDEALDFMMAEILTVLALADEKGTLTPLKEEVFDMPFTAIEYPQDDEEEEPWELDEVE